MTGQEDATFIVGRERETAEIGRLIEETASGRPQVLALGGEAGIGKTTLAARAAEIASAEGFEVIWCALHEREATRPYELWIAFLMATFESLRDGAPNSDGSNGSDGSDRRLLSRAEIASIFGRSWPLVASLLSSPPATIESSTGGTQGTPRAPQRQQDLFDAFVAFFRYLAGGRKIVLVADNLHLADEESLAALDIAVSQIDYGRVMSVLTYRTTKPTSIDGPLADTLGSMSHNGNVVRIRLDRLSRDDVGLMIDHAGGPAAPDMIDAIFERSEGNPLLVRELIELSRIEGRVPDARAFSESALSIRARATIAARASTLSSRQREALVVAATVGLTFSVAQVSEYLSNMDSREVNDCMRASLRLGILTEAEGSGPNFRFSHAIIREAVLHLVPPAERASMSAAVGRKLEAFYGPNALNHAHELYPHFLVSRHHEDSQKGIRYALAAGNSALGKFAWKRALELFGMLLSSYDEFMTPADRAAALVGMGSAYCGFGDRVKAVESLRPAFDYYVFVRDFDRMVEIARQPIDFDLGDSYQFPLIEQAVRVVPENHPGRPELLRLYANGLFEARGRYAEAERLVRENLEQARANGDRLSETHLLLDRVYLDIRSSRFDEAIAGATEVLARTAIEPDPFAESHANFLLMQAYLLEGDLETSKRYANLSRSTIVPIGDNMLTCVGIAHVLRFELRAGNWEEIERETDRGLAIHPDDLFLLPIRAMSEYHQGRFETGDEFLERLLQTADGYPEPRALIFASILQLVAHRWEISRNGKYLNHARALVSRMLAFDLVPGVEMRVRIAQAILACEAANADEARAALERLSAMPDYNLIRRYRIERALGLAGHLCEDYERAAGHFLEAISSSRRFQDLPALAWTYAGFGDLLSDPNSFGSHADAEDAYAKALTLAAGLEMAPLAQRIRDALAGLEALDARHAGSTLGRRLTARELEVLAFVAEGKTDAEIAATLGLSNYTVSNHVRHILRKTGAYNRIEAVRYAERTGLL